MICKECNTENESGAIFCSKCGERLGKEAQTEQAQKEPEKKEEIKSEPTDQKSTCPTTETTKDNEESPLSLAWKDIRSTQGWFIKCLLLGLLKCVPILGWVVQGYAMNYGKTAGKESSSAMPKGYFEDHSFRNGFFEFVIALVYGLVFVVASSIVATATSWIICLGAIISLALLVFSIFYNSYTSLSAMRGCKDGEIGKSFSIKEIFSAYKKAPGKVFFAYFIPSLICGAIVLLIGGIVFAIVASTAWPYILHIIQVASQHSATIWTYILSDIIAIISTASVALIVFVIVANVFSAFDVVLRYRALGHWINRYAPEWNK